MVVVVVKHGGEGGGLQNAPIGADFGGVVDCVTPALVEKVDET